MKKDAIKTIISDFHTNPAPTLKPREMSLPAQSGKIISLIGPRRAGKTSVLLLMAAEMEASGTDRTKILYINFEDERLDLRINELDLIIQAYRELYPDHDISACSFMFDEIQNIDGWEKFIMRLYDTVSRNIFLTGSNSKFLSSDIASALRGRTVSFDVYPLSFREYLAFRGIAADMKSSSSSARVSRAFEDYVLNGGFPETVEYDAPFRQRVLQEYYNVMISRDLVERYGISNSKALRYFLHKALASTSSEFSVNRVYNDLSSSGIRVGKNLLYTFLEACRDIQLAFSLRKYSSKVVSRELGERKIYAIDPGLLNAVSFKFSDDTGKAFELIVFLELMRSGAELFFYKDRHECDFIIKSGSGISHAIQVCADISDSRTLKRELDGLVAACKRFGLKDGLILTSEDAADINVDAITVHVSSVKRWLLKKQQY